MSHGHIHLCWKSKPFERTVSEYSQSPCRVGTESSVELTISEGKKIKAVVFLQLSVLGMSSGGTMNASMDQSCSHCEGLRVGRQHML